MGTCWALWRLSALNTTHGEREHYPPAQLQASSASVHCNSMSACMIVRCFIIECYFRGPESSLRVENGAVFWIDPAAAPETEEYVVGQLTVRTLTAGQSLDVVLSAQGRSRAGPDWSQRSIRFSLRHVSVDGGAAPETSVPPQDSVTDSSIFRHPQQPMTTSDRRRPHHAIQHLMISNHRRHHRQQMSNCPRRPRRPRRQRVQSTLHHLLRSLLTPGIRSASTRWSARLGFFVLTAVSRLKVAVVVTLTRPAPAQTVALGRAAVRGLAARPGQLSAAPPESHARALAANRMSTGGSLFQLRSVGTDRLIVLNSSLIQARSKMKYSR